MDETDARRCNHWVNHIARHAHAKPGAIYLRFEGVSVTWAQLYERIGVVAAALRQRGVKAGDRVAIMMTNRPEFLETMFAANALGAIVVPVNFRLAPAEIAYILTDCVAGPRAVLSHQNLQCQSLTLIRAWRLFADDEVNLCARSASR